MKKIELFGIKFDNSTMEEVIERIKGFLVDGGQHYIVLPYSEFVVRAQKDEEFRNILNQADLCLCESRGLYLMARLIGKKLRGVINGVDLIYNLVEKSEIQNPCLASRRAKSETNSKFKIQNSKFFLLGGIQEVVEKVKQKLGRNIIGAENGYQDFNMVIEKINLLKPDISLVGLGSPKQEKFIAENLSKMPSVKVAVGVGGAFDFISGKVRRAPKLIQKIGLEWLWRLILQPQRMGRIFKGVFGLTWLTFKNMLSLK